MGRQVTEPPTELFATVARSAAGTWAVIDGVGRWAQVVAVPGGLVLELSRRGGWPLRVRRRFARRGWPVRVRLDGARTMPCGQAVPATLLVRPAAVLDPDTAAVLAARHLDGKRMPLRYRTRPVR